MSHVLFENRKLLFYLFINCFEFRYLFLQFLRTRIWFELVNVGVVLGDNTGNWFNIQRLRRDVLLQLLLWRWINNHCFRQYRELRIKSLSFGCLEPWCDKGLVVVPYYDVWTWFLCLFCTLIVVCPGLPLSTDAMCIELSALFYLKRSIH